MNGLWNGDIRGWMKIARSFEGVDMTCFLCLGREIAKWLRKQFKGPTKCLVPLGSSVLPTTTYQRKQHHGGMLKFWQMFANHSKLWTPGLLIGHDLTVLFRRKVLVHPFSDFGVDFAHWSVERNRPTMTLQIGMEVNLIPKGYDLE